MDSPDTLPIIRPGDRAIIAGRTGSGKSTLACWLLNRSVQHWVILNPKWTKAYSKLPDSNVLKNFRETEFNKSVEKYRYTVLNFERSGNNPEYIDSIVMYMHESFENIGLCADELYTMHIGGKPGEGLIAWLTRGRELRQTFLGLMQRPTWVSRFCFSEADMIIGMDLALLEDRKKMYDCSGCEHFKDRLAPRKWLRYNVADDDVKKYGAVPPIK